MRHFKTSLFILIIIATIPLSSFSHDGDTHISPGKSKADSLDSCVEPTKIMQKKHHMFLLHQRDKTVVDGVRTKKHSFANCIDCHVNYDDQGKAIPINAEGQFCQECHVKTATNITCFSCHAAEPRFPKHKEISKSNLDDLKELAHRITKHE